MVKRKIKDVTREIPEPIANDPFLSLLEVLPKADLHVHLDGSLRPSSLVELASNAEGLDSMPPLKDVFRTRYASLEDYLVGFKYTTAVMRDAVSLDRIAYEFAHDCYKENVFYFEVRFAPLLHADPLHDFDIVDVIVAVNKGLCRATEEANADDQNARRPKGRYGIIVCALRSISSEMGPYYETLGLMHPFASLDILASMTLAVSAVAARKTYGLPVCGFDLAGIEEGMDNAEHFQAAECAARGGLRITVHAGEASGPDSVASALRALRAERIGHGIHILRDDLVVTKADIEDGESTGAKFVDELIREAKARGTCFEVCPTSNIQTIPELTFEKHPLKEMRNQGLTICVCTDNRLVSNTTLTEELRAAYRMGLSVSDMKEIILAGFESSFFPGSHEEKQEFIDEVKAYYDEVMSRGSA